MAHLLNVRKDAYDPRDRVVAPAAPTTPLRLSFRSQVPYIKDQGAAGSCTAHAGTSFLELAFRKHKSCLPSSIDRSTLRFSPLFLYAKERMSEGTFRLDAGADSRTIFRVLTSTGVCLETQDAYDDHAIFTSPTQQMVDEAQMYKLGAYHRILDVETAKTVLQSGYTFTVGTPLFDQFESDEAAATGLIRLPKGSSIGGHEMHIIGCDDTKNVFGEIGAMEVQNSWSETWGDKGYAWIPYSYFEATAGEWDFWTGHFGAPWHQYNGNGANGGYLQAAESKTQVQVVCAAPKPPLQFVVPLNATQIATLRTRLHVDPQATAGELDNSDADLQWMQVADGIQITVSQRKSLKARLASDAMIQSFITKELEGSIG